MSQLFERRKNNRMVKTGLLIISVLLLSYFSISPFFVDGFFSFHDDTQVERVFTMHKSLSDGQFPVRWVADLGYHYGYPIFNFYAPFAYYVGAFSMALGFDALSSTKIMMALGVILSGASMYLFAREFWGRLGGMLSALLYVYAPYHAVNVYVRGAVAEFWAYAFIPFAFYGIYKVFLFSNNSLFISKNQKVFVCGWIIVGALGYAGVIISHNLTAMMVTPFLFAFTLLLVVFTKSKKALLLSTLYVFLLSFSLSAFYWLPVFTEMHYTNVLSQVGGGSDYKDHFVCPMQLITSPWGFGGSTPTCLDGMSYIIGKAHLVLFVFGFFGIVFLRREGRIQRLVGWFAVLSALIATFLLLKESKIIWDSIPQMAFLQFPWRFLLIVTFFISFVGGGALFLLQKLPRVPLFFAWSILIIGVIVINADHFVPQKFNQKDVAEYTSVNNLWWRTSKISDEYLPADFEKPQEETAVPTKKISSRDGFVVDSLTETTNRITAKIHAQKSGELLIHHAYFPGWSAMIDNQEAIIQPDPQGIRIFIPQGEHTLMLSYHQTAIEQVGNLLSMTGFLMIILGIIKVIKSSNRRSSIN